MVQELKKFYEEYKSVLAAYNIANGTVYFDISTICPRDGVSYRNQMSSILAGEAFSYQMNPESLKKIDELYNLLDDDDDLKKEIKLFNRSIEDEKNLPKELFIRFSKTVADSQEAWLNAKLANDYSLFKDHLINVIKVQKEVCSYANKTCSDYDYLLDRFQMGMNQEKYDRFFDLVKSELLPLIKRIQSEGKKIDESPINGKFDVEKQAKFSEAVQKFLLVDKNKCYQGTTEHPFTQFFSPNEARITTHYYEENPLFAIFSTVHEYGHALYSLQVNPDYQDTAFKDAIGSAMHESQSRLLENHIGRSRGFWKNLYPVLQETFPENFKDVAFDDFMDIINISKPSLIRTEADELTYPIHILIRYELEKLIFDGEVDYDHLDELWNEKYEEYLGIRPDSDAHGILQDMHWGAANLGYFPTYALGSAYAAQFYHAMNAEFDVEAALQNNEFNKVQEWLKNNIHVYGAYYTADEILEKATGETFNPNYYINYLKDKFMKVYNLK